MDNLNESITDPQIDNVSDSAIVAGDENAVTSVCPDCRSWIVETKYFETLSEEKQDLIPDEIPRTCFPTCIALALEEEIERIESNTKTMNEKIARNLARVERNREILKANLDILVTVAQLPRHPIDPHPSISLSRALSLGKKHLGFNDDDSYRIFEEYLRKHELFPDDESADQTGLPELENALRLLDSVNLDYEQLEL